MKHKALFIINPVSGGRRKDNIGQLIAGYLDTKVFEPTIQYSESVSHAHKIARDAVGTYQMVVAVGGDGTVNEIASGIAGTDLVLGIIPCGSGNGLARFLQIPIDIKKSILTLNTYKVELIDAAKLNGQWFFNMAGMGFDAHISELFSHNKTRGFFAYIKTSLKEFMSYKPQPYQLIVDGKSYSKDAFMLSFANSSQYGNNAHISPHASVQDGLIDVCVIKPLPVYRFPDLVIRMFAKLADTTKYVEIIRGKHVLVKRTQPGPIHLDGEPQLMDTDAEINVVPAILKVVVGETYSITR